MMRKIKFSKNAVIPDLILMKKDHTRSDRQVLIRLSSDN